MKKLTNLFLAAVMVVGVTSIAGCIQGESNNKYDITVKATVGGVITTDKTQAEKGETVNITATPADGYYLESLSYNGNNSYYAFAMPSEDVEVTATFAAVTASVKQYDIIVDTSIGGEFTVNTAVAPSYLKAPAGTTVSLTYAPADGYVLDYIELNGEKLEKGADSFIMPAKIANVYACFASEVNEYTVETQNVEKGGVVTVNRQTCGQGGVVIADYIPMNGYVLDYFTINGEKAQTVGDDKCKLIVGECANNVAVVSAVFVPVNDENAPKLVVTKTGGTATSYWYASYPDKTGDGVADGVEITVKVLDGNLVPNGNNENICDYVECFITIDNADTATMLKNSLHPRFTAGNAIKWRTAVMNGNAFGSWSTPAAPTDENLFSYTITQKEMRNKEDGYSGYEVTFFIAYSCFGDGTLTEGQVRILPAMNNVVNIADASNTWTCTAGMDFTGGSPATCYLIDEDGFFRAPTAKTVEFAVEGTTYHTVVTDKDGYFTMPEAPDLGEGYVFEGWYLDEGTYQTAFDGTAAVTENTKVYAKMYKYLLNPTNGGTIETLNEGSKVWSTNEYVFLNIPKVFEDKPYILWSINGTNAVTALKSGWVYGITGMARGFGNDAQSQMEKFDGYNFTLLDTSFWNIWDANLKNNYIYEKYVEEGETFEFGRWSVLIMSDTQLDVYANQPMPLNTELAELSPSGSDTVLKMELGAKVFSDRAQYFYSEMPYWLEGKNYIQNAYSAASHSATVTKSGDVYMFTSKAGNISLVNTLVSSGWTDVTSMIPSDMVLFAGGTFMGDTYKGFALLKKYFEKGETVTWGQWGIPVFSGETQLNAYVTEPIPTDKDLAVLKPSGTDTVLMMELAAKVFSDRPKPSNPTYQNYKFYDMPFWLAGKNYIQIAYDAASHSATVTKSGYVYMFTSKGGSISLVSTLVADGWTDVTETIPSDLNLFGDSTQNGAFLSSPYNGFALLKKYVEKDETVTWGKWGIPVFSGEFVVADDIAKLESAADTTYPAKVEEGMRLFSDRVYYAMNGIPTGLEGLTYFMDSIDNGATVKAVTAGTAYLMIPSGNTAYATLESEVLEAGWTLVPHRPFRLATGLLFGNQLYSKQVEVGEEIHFGKYNLVFGAPLDNEEDYYVLPSVTQPAVIINNPDGNYTISGGYNVDDFTISFDINLQNWLGCPTIERTANGRTWAGWFQGGYRELGTGNYAIIYYSDDDCVSWKKALAIVPPVAAVQVTKPELWTAPNGDLWLFWIQHTGTGNFDGRMGTWASVCTNPDAETPVWSAPKRLTDGYMRSKPIIVNVNGTTTWMYAAFDWMEAHYTRIYASTDAGATWSLRGKAECIDYSSGKNNLDDPVLVQKPDGRLWLLLRPSNGTAVYESFSSDGGYTWTHARATNIVGAQSRLTVDLLPNGNMLMVFHDSTNRSHLTAYLSEDGGETWAYKLLLDERLYVSYPDTIITSDGTIYVIYDRNRTTDLEVWMTVFMVEDIKAGAYVSNKAQQKVLVDKKNRNANS